MVKHYKHPNDGIAMYDKYGLKSYGHTIFDACPRVENSFNMLHSIQDVIYYPYLKDEIGKYLKHGLIE